MGLFGRDDTSTKNRTAPATPPSRAAQTPPSKPLGPSSAVTMIARPARFEGVLEGAGDIHIEGELDGAISGSGSLFIAENGRVKASLHAKLVTVSGRVRGDISADEKIELTPSADVEGNLTAPRILIREGATFEGQVNMKDPRKQLSSAPKNQVSNGGAAHGSKSKTDSAKDSPSDTKNQT